MNNFKAKVALVIPAVVLGLGFSSTVLAASYVATFKPVPSAKVEAKCKGFLHSWAAGGHFSDADLKKGAPNSLHSADSRNKIKSFKLVMQYPLTKTNQLLATGVGTTVFKMKNSSKTATIKWVATSLVNVKTGEVHGILTAGICSTRYVGKIVRRR